MSRVAKWVGAALLGLTLLGSGARPALAQGAAEARAAAKESPASDKGGKAALSGVVNLNQASADELERLPGIGPAKARAIVDWRQKHPFRKPDELVRVKGIGRKTFGKLRPYLTLQGPTTLAAESRD